MPVDEDGSVLVPAFMGKTTISVAIVVGFLGLDVVKCVGELELDGGVIRYVLCQRHFRYRPSHVDRYRSNGRSHLTKSLVCLFFQMTT